MADPESNDSSTALSSRRQTPCACPGSILAATFGAYNFSSRTGEGPASPGSAPNAAATSGAVSGSSSRADVADALEALEPLLRFLNLETTPGSLEELAAALGGYHVTTLIASLSDPTDSRLGYDFDMATEAIQRAIESEGYTLDRFRFPWLDSGSSARPGSSSAASRRRSRTRRSSRRMHPVRPLDRRAARRGPDCPARRTHERQPGTILFRIDRDAPRAGSNSRSPGALAAPSGR